ncbi:helix-turn-helix domain-containing protein [Flavobacterium branchiarum]|uniref:Helix-turn-helix domain-containing protein n=1 Tax=Flavobacterium branchiarum TaxID=1114870 RepID=A0ABV5FHG3_9FLAO|nr:helix-turn-helix domain-containing protein [Flavobacterium branchiarum]MDN3673874.1 helix-turn-helix domain-containing protein [Flavobacterium branchiarum]
MIINEVKKHLGFKKDVDFATYLGISQSTLSAWHRRGSINYVLIITKCKDIDANWLLTGKGKMLKPETERILNADKIEFKEDLNKEIELLTKLVESQKETIESQKIVVRVLYEKVYSKSIEDDFEFNDPLAQNIIDKIESTVVKKTNKF